MSVKQDEEYRRGITERIELGLDAESFLSSKLGKRLRERAQAEALDAMELLKTVDPTDTKAIIAAQNTIFRAESFDFWLDELMTDGKAAEEQLIGDDQ